MKRRLIVASFIILVAIVGFNVIHWASSPSSTKQSSLGGKQDSGVLGSTSDLTPFTSPYFTTQIPSTMRLKTSNESSSNPVRAGYLFTSTVSSPADQIAITVGTMGLNRLSEISGVKQRLNNPSTYETTEVPNAPEGAMSFKRTSDYETAVFWQEDDLYVALVVSGSPLRQAELDQTVQSVLTNWSWR